MNEVKRAEHESLENYLQQALTPEQREGIGLITFNHWSFAVGTVVETVLAARELGSRVVVGFWADNTPLPDVGWRSSRFFARLVNSATRDQQAQRALIKSGVPLSTFVDPPIRRWKSKGLPPIPDPLTRANIRQLTYHGTAMGPAILEMPPEDMPVREDHVWPRRWVAAAMRSYAWAYDQATALIQQHSLGTVVVYNGRFTHDRAVAAAAKALGVRVLYYDTGGYDTDFDLTEATTHDWAHLQVRMLQMYRDWDPTDRDLIGSSWFDNRRAHTDANNRRYTGIQEQGRVEELPQARKLVVYFSSSDDELVELDIDWQRYFGSQERALRQLADACRQQPDTALVVRTHPHMRLKPPQDLADWLAAVEAISPDLHFGPESPVDSYALMDRADVVFTYGSTSGVEAGYFGRPVAVMGPSAYDQLGCARRITNAAGIAEAIKSPPEPNSTAAIAYGLMMQRRGFTYQYQQHAGNDALELQGAVIAEASTTAQKASDALRKLRIWWLTRA